MVSKTLIMTIKLWFEGTLPKLQRHNDTPGPIAKFSELHHTTTHHVRISATLVVKEGEALRIPGYNGLLITFTL